MQIALKLSKNTYFLKLDMLKTSTKHVTIFQVLEVEQIACKVYGLDPIPKHKQTFQIMVMVHIHVK